MNTAFSTVKHPSLLKAILEGFIDGILIVTEHGEWIHANDRARRICRQFAQGLSQPDRVPHEIWSACQRLIDTLNPTNCTTTAEDEIAAGKSMSYRVRAQWLPIEPFQPPYLL